MPTLRAPRGRWSSPSASRPPSATGSGTAAGPAAILKASQQLELYDDELQCEPYLAYGVAALRAPEIATPIEAALDQLAASSRACCTTASFRSRSGGSIRSLPAPSGRWSRATPISWCWIRRPRRPARRLPGRALFARRRHAPRARSPGRVAGLGRHPRRLPGRGRVLRRPTATASPFTGPRTRRAGTSTPSLRRFADRPVYVTFDIDAPGVGVPVAGMTAASSASMSKVT